VSELLAVVVGSLVSVLPRRLWSRFELPVERGAWVSALTTVAVGFFVGVDSYLRFAKALGEATAAQVIELSYRQMESGASQGNPGLPLLATAVSIFSFLITPLGLVALYLVASGTIRAIGCAVDQPSGDPLLTVLDHYAAKHRRRSEAEQEEAERAALEGPATPDLLQHGPDPDHPHAEWTLIASRVKPGWDRGVFVVTTDRWYRISDVFDKKTEMGLRRFYVLEAVGQAEVIRRSVYYDHPDLSLMHERKQT